jgi:hypothetical protein
MDKKEDKVLKKVKYIQALATKISKGNPAPPRRPGEGEATPVNRKNTTTRSLRSNSTGPRRPYQAHTCRHISTRKKHKKKEERHKRRGRTRIPHDKNTQKLKGPNHSQLRITSK